MRTLHLAAIAVASAAGGQVLAASHGMRAPGSRESLFYLTLVIVGFGSALVLFGYVIKLAIEREPNPTPRVIAAVKQAISTDVLWNRIAPLLLLYPFLGAFGTFKALIPYVNPFWADGLLSDLDRLVLGTDAWRITHSLVGPSGTYVLDVAYGLWLLVWSLALIYFCVIAPHSLRRRFITSFVGCWILLGIVAATLLSSVGPCFLELIGHPYASRYADLSLDGAYGTPSAQAMLASSYEAAIAGAGQGISAMPSLHVAIAALLVLAFRHVGRIPFALAGTFYAVILFGSVHLGWHYLSDGLLGTAGAIAIWKLSSRPGEAVRRWPAPRQSRHKSPC